MADGEGPVRRLRASKYKLTRQRQAVLSAIASSESHLDAAEVYEKASAECPGIGLTTVYRTLDILVQLGLARRVHLEEGCHRYAPASEGHRHHLVCTGCGRAVEFVGCDLSSFLDAVASETGFEIEEHWLQLLGKCPSCK